MIVDRILQLIDYKGISKNKFYKETGLSNGFLDKVKDVGVSKIEKILSIYTEVNPIWILTGKGEMVVNQEEGNLKNKEQTPQNFANFLENKFIPLVNAMAVGGFGSESFTISEEDIKEYYIIPKFKYSKIDFMIEVRGDSMRPRYTGGDIVACSIIKDRSFIQWNRIHVIATREQGIILKRIGQSNKAGHLRVIAENKDYPDFDIPVSEITGLALVAGGVLLE